MVISGQTLDRKWYVALNKRTGKEGHALIHLVNLGERRGSRRRREGERECVYRQGTCRCCLVVVTLNAVPLVTKSQIILFPTECAVYEHIVCAYLQYMDTIATCTCTL